MSNQKTICLSGKNSTLQPTAQPSEMGKMFSYNGNGVTMRLRNGVVYVNLTEVAKSFPSKNLSTIVNSQEIKEYCKALSEIKNFSSADLLMVSKGGDRSRQGTWAHQKVALRVAQKLSPEFAVWVDTKIEELLSNGVATAKDDDEAIAYAMGVLRRRLSDANSTITSQSQQLREQAPKVEYTDNVLKSVNTYTSTQMAKELDLRTAEQLHGLLKGWGVMIRQSGQWLLAARYCGQGARTITYTRSDGSQGTNTITVWSELGRWFLHQLMAKKGGAQ